MKTYLLALVKNAFSFRKSTGQRKNKFEYKNAKMVENMMVDKSQSEVIENLGRCFASSANFGFKKVHFPFQSGQFFIQNRQS